VIFLVLTPPLDEDWRAVDDAENFGMAVKGTVAMDVGLDAWEKLL
jgi:hypothetical protein